MNLSDHMLDPTARLNENGDDIKSPMIHPIKLIVLSICLFYICPREYQ